MASPEPPLSFGKHFAILNLDWMELLLTAIEETQEGKTLIDNLSQWNEAIHDKSPRPLTVFTTLAFNPGQPELAANKPFARLIESFGTFEVGNPGVEIDKRFKVDRKDVVLRKTRWSATTGNNLEQILRAQSIDTVIISGLSLSGVVMATVYRLFDLDYNIFVIADNVLELPPDQNPAYSKVLLESLLPKMNLKVISLAQALQALNES